MVILEVHRVFNTNKEDEVGSHEEYPTRYLPYPDDYVVSHKRTNVWAAWAASGSSQRGGRGPSHPTSWWHALASWQGCVTNKQKVVKSGKVQRNLETVTVALLAFHTCPNPHHVPLANKPGRIHDLQSEETFKPSKK